MVSNVDVLQSAPVPMAVEGLVPLEVEGLKRLNIEARAAYWMRFLNGRWLVYWHERLIGDFPAENATLALDFLRQKQNERPAHQ